MKLAALAVALSAASASAFAADNDSGVYLGGGVGYSAHSVDGCDNRDCSKSDVGFKVFGGYQFNPNFALEAAYIDLGKIKASNSYLTETLATTSFTLAAVGMVPMNNSASFLAKLGMHASRSKYRLDSKFVNEAIDDSHTGVLLGVGAQYKFTNNLIGRVEWEWLSQANRIRNDKGDVNLLTANIIYKF
jgi:OOP family OmpA-OmpF porin